MYLCIFTYIYINTYIQNNNEIYIIRLKREKYCLRRQFIIVKSLLIFTYTIVFILWV